MKKRLAALGVAIIALVILVYVTMIRPPADLASTAGNVPIAAATSEPVGEIVLTVSKTASGQEMTVARYDLAGLQSLPKVSFETTTTWTDGVQKFEGVDLKGFLDEIGATTGTLIATAFNDYRIEIPISEIAAGGPMIAYHLNGALMPVRDKGPLWIVYPYDADPEYQSEVVFSRSIWQLNRLEIAP